MKKHDWIKLRRDFIEGVADAEGATRWPTLDEVARANRIRPGHLRAVAAREQWTKEKSIYRARLEQLQREKHLQAQAEQSAQFDTLMFNIARALGVTLNNNIAQATRSNRELTLNARKVMADILEKIQRAGRLALGDPTEHQKIELPRGVFRIAGRSAPSE